MNLKQKLSKKLKKAGGFTLIEMLIVVAIIAILVAVSIPMVNASLNKAKTATDDANERAAKGAAVTEYLLKESNMGTQKFYCYDAQKGKANEVATVDTCSGTPKAYGQGSVPGEDSLSTGSDARTGHVHVAIAADGTATVTWK